MTLCRRLVRLAASALVALSFLQPLVPAARADGEVDRRPWANEPGPRSGRTTPPGRWQVARDAVEPELTDEQLREIERLESIGYLGGYKPAAPSSGVTIHDPELTQDGLNFYTSGHSPGAFLMDSDGNVLHEWSQDFLKAWPDAAGAIEPDRTNRWRYAHLLPNGDVLAIYEGAGLLKLDKDSRIIWKRRGGFHHDLKVMPDGRIVVLLREAHVVPRIHETRPILEDFIVVLDNDGRELARVSLLEALERSKYAHYLEETRPFGDILHTNAVQVLPAIAAEDPPAFEQGNVLTSFREIDLVAVVDMESEKVVWADQGDWDAQHDPTQLRNGNVLVFDNRGNEGYSRVSEFDPVTMEVVWSYEGDVPPDFHSDACGASQRLPNGNTLITESDNGRAFEVTPDGRTVWEFRNPERAGERNELVATLFEVKRLRTDFPTYWLDED